jgi:hypothetical protein
MQAEAAEVIAIQALGWLASEADRLADFLGVTGASPGDIAAAAGDRGFLASVLDFVLQTDDSVTAFCAAAGLAPTTPMLARAVLAGEAGRHWT